MKLRIVSIAAAAALLSTGIGLAQEAVTGQSPAAQTRDEGSEARQRRSFEERKALFVKNIATGSNQGWLFR